MHVLVLAARLKVALRAVDQYRVRDVDRLGAVPCLQVIHVCGGGGRGGGFTTAKIPTDRLTRYTHYTHYTIYTHYTHYTHSTHYIHYTYTSLNRHL